MVGKKIFQTIAICSIVLLISSCGSKDETIDEDKLGFIEADVESEETNLKNKADFGLSAPGESDMYTRAFENAPPMIPHTTEGFLPIKMDNNICLSCHMPELADSIGAVPIPETHFVSLRPKMVLKDGVYSFENEGEVHIEEQNSLNNSYFSCSQCHAPQSSIKVDITNLFTPEFRDKFGLNKSDLKSKLEEGTQN